MKSFSTLTERADVILRMLAAYSMILFLFMLNIVSVSYPLTGLIKAPFFLMTIYYWAIYRPTLMPAWFVFIAGCVMDFLSGFPVGLSAFVFLLIQWTVTDQRRFLMGQSFMVVWFGFVVVSLGTIAAQWAVFSLIQTQFLPVQSLLVSSVFGIALFPVICIMLHFTHKLLPAQSMRLHIQT